MKAGVTVHEMFREVADSVRVRNVHVPPLAGFAGTGHRHCAAVGGCWADEAAVVVSES